MSTALTIRGLAIGRHLILQNKCLINPRINSKASLPIQRTMSSLKHVAKLKSSRTYQAPGKLLVTEYHFKLPLDHSKTWDPERNTGETITVFARGVRKFEKLINPLSPKEEKKKSQLPWLVFFEGGPGPGCRPPDAYPWIPFLLEKGYQILLLDQRGMGLSNTITSETLALRGDATAQAEYLKLFRQTHTVFDAESIREYLTSSWTNVPESHKKWSTLGQSYGGFVTLSYLSFAPEGLRECFVAGGLAPISQDGPDEVYKRCFKRAEARNRAFYEKFPEDGERVRRIVKFLREKEVKLPDAARLTAERFMSLGMRLGMNGYFESLHNNILSVVNDLDHFDSLTRPTLSTLQAHTSFDEAIIYAILHEPIYCQGGSAPNWSAERIKSSLPTFSLDHSSPAPFFTPEAVFPSTFTSASTINALHPTVTDLLFREASNWPPLYDLSQLAKNTVPVYAAVYLNDMYVDFDFSMETARLVKNCIVKVDGGDGWMHNALGRKVGEVMENFWRLREEGEDGWEGRGPEGLGD